MKSQDEEFTTKLVRVKNIRMGVKYAVWCIQSFGEIAKIRHMVHMVGKELNGSTNPQTKTSSMDTRLDFTIKSKLLHVLCHAIYSGHMLPCPLHGLNEFLF